MDKKQIFTYQPLVGRSDKEHRLNQKGMVYWLTGLSGSGKSTIANQFEKELHSFGIMTVLLDGDIVRSGLNKDLGFSESDRKENIRRVAEICKICSGDGLVVIAPLISPFGDDRKMAREIIGKDFVEVFVDASVDTCIERDPKGLYKKAKAGEIKNFTGVSSPYESPKSPEIHLTTDEFTVGVSVSKLIEHYADVLNSSSTKRIIPVGNVWGKVNYGNFPLNLTDNQHAVFIGRFQPLHHGHIRMFRQKLDQGVPLLIMVRDIDSDENNPFTTEQTVEMIKIVFEGEPVKVISIPDIESVNWGRGVGYELNEYIPPKQTGAISATQIRKLISEGNDEWKNMMDPKIHDYVSRCLSVNSDGPSV